MVLADMGLFERPVDHVGHGEEYIGDVDIVTARQRFDVFSAQRKDRAGRLVLNRGKRRDDFQRDFLGQRQGE
jgi:hypothetical protein